MRATSRSRPLTRRTKHPTDQGRCAGKLTLLQGDGSVVEEIRLSSYGSDILDPALGFEIGAFSPHPPKGEYTARVELSPQGTSHKLQQPSVRLVARDYLCGCEIIPPPS